MNKYSLLSRVFYPAATDTPIDFAISMILSVASSIYSLILAKGSFFCNIFTAISEAISSLAFVSRL